MAKRINALHSPGEDTTDGDGSDDSPAVSGSEERQWTIAIAQYREALRLQSIEENDKSEVILKELLSIKFISQGRTPTRGEEFDFDRSKLKYSIYKNLAIIASRKCDSRSVIEAILEAVRIDPRDVTMWCDLGIHAKQIDHITLARFAFERGLERCERHWPCLDNLITILFVLGDYQCCLTYISRALEIDSSYAKGIILRRKIYTEQPFLREFTSAHFEFCDPEAECPTVDPAYEANLLEEVMRASQKRVEACGPEFRELPEVSFPGGLSQLTWICLGEALEQLYCYVASKKPDLSFCCRVDVAQYLKKDTPKDVPVEAAELVGISAGHVKRSMLTSAEEKHEVEEFLARLTENGGVLDLIEYYLMELASKHHLQWPQFLVDVYMSLFKKLRKHMRYPSYQCIDEIRPSFICSLAKAGLLQLEFTIDKAAGFESRNGQPLASTTSSTKDQNHLAITNAHSQDTFRIDSCPGCSYVDMLWLKELTSRADIMGDNNLTSYSLRYFWAEGRMMLLEGRNVNAASSFLEVRNLLGKTSQDLQEIKLANCQYHNVISLSLVESQIRELQRDHQLEEVTQPAEYMDH